MSTLTIKVSSFDDIIADVAAGRPRVDVYSFPTWEALHATLTPKRLDIIEAMKGQGSMSMRSVADRVDRGFKGVHTDITALLNCGILDRSADGVSFPYDGLHIDVSLGQVAA